MSWNVYYALWLQASESLQRASRCCSQFTQVPSSEANDLLGRAGQIADAILEIDPEIVSLQDPRSVWSCCETSWHVKLIPVQELWQEWDEILAELNQKSPGEIWEFARGGAPVRLVCFASAA